MKITKNKVRICFLKGLFYMSVILEKLGIYDLVAVLLTGINISIFTICVFKYIYKYPIFMNWQIKESLFFLVISYFVGIIFQELGSIILKKVFFRNNLLLKLCFESSNDSDILLTNKEIQDILNYVNKKLSLNKYEYMDNINIIYNYCKFKVLESGEFPRTDKDQTISAMSRSLSLYFLILFSFLSFSSFQTLNMVYYIASICSALLSILFYKRCVRFTKIRYIYILRLYYYKFLYKN